MNPILRVLGLSILLSLSIPSRAETGYDAWLRYPAIEDAAIRQRYDSLPAVVVLAGESAILDASRQELLRGMEGMLGHKLRVATQIPREGAIVIGSVANIRKLLPASDVQPEEKPDAFAVKTFRGDGQNHLIIAGADDRGALYGTFALLRKISLHEPIARLDLKEAPYAPIRFLNHWDNLNGTIERGYAGKSIFWDNDHIVQDLGRVRDYARLMASVGINGCSINNVNADVRVVTPEYLQEVARVAEAFRPWGVRLVLSLDFASPRKIGKIDTFDPLDPRSIEFWKNKIDEIYRVIPDLAGFVLKADSEGRLGPSQYGRTHADAANSIARAIKPHGGVLFYRGFVYNHLMDWHDTSLDRATAAYDNFHKLDGTFEDNVIVQIKEGPIDFQVREPASPLFGGLEKTSQAIELQITQEYLGQQRHTVYVVPMWKEVLDFDMQAKGQGTPVKAIVSGKTFHRSTGGFVAVSNVGRDANWLGNHLAMANLYGYGRLAWNPELSSRQIAEEWTRMTFGHDPRALDAIVDIQLKSWPAYERYTGPLGAGGLTDIINVHYGPAVESSEYNGWGQWHRANETGIGMNRSIADGTGFIGQYSPVVAARFESLKTCPDELLLFMHHVPYTHVLHSGKTVIQHIYDSHYEGAAQAAEFVDIWKKLDHAVDESRYHDVLAQLEYQAGHAIVWRDAINGWFLKKSGIADAHGRAGHFPNRIEAESMKLDGYSTLQIKPFEAASGERAIEVSSANRHGSASFNYAGAAGWFDLAVEYFDENDGESQFKLFVNGQQMDSWIANRYFPSVLPDSHTSIRRTIAGLALRPGDEIRLEGVANGKENAVIDYVEILPVKN